MTNKELANRMAIKKTLRQMETQIQKLEEEKKKYIDSGREAKEKGLDGAYKLAVVGLKMTMSQQKKIQEMYMNLKLTSQMKETAEIVKGFLDGMSSISKELVKTTKAKDLLKTQKQFEEASESVAMQQDNLEIFTNSILDTFQSGLSMDSEDTAEIEKLMTGDTTVSGDIISDDEIEKAMANIKA